MPELPEVEVVKRSLNKKIQNLIIKSIKLNTTKLRYRINTKHIKKIIGLKLIKILRRSKFLIFIFEKNIIMLVHLGMTGKFFFTNNKNKKYKTSFYYELNERKDEKHNRIIFKFSRGQKLIYNDIRKFGFIKILNKQELHRSLHLKSLGPEPFEKKFNFKYFKDFLAKRKRMIKDILMDQRFVSGLGNIYANEVLFFSKIKPMKKADSIQDYEIKRVIFHTKRILKIAISFGGSSLKDFSSSDGKKGRFQQYFSVYGKSGEICSNKNCNKRIRKIVIGGRASFYCSRCQK